MSVPLTGKVTSLTIKNTLHANEIWTESINVRNSEDRSYTNVMKYIDDKLRDIKILEDQMKSTIQAVTQAVDKIKQQPIVPPQQQSVKGEKGDPGPQGPQGPQGKPGLKGAKGDTIKSLSSIPDVDVSQLKNGSVLVWSEEKKKWVTQVFELE